MASSPKYLPLHVFAPFTVTWILILVGYILATFDPFGTPLPPERRK